MDSDAADTPPPVDTYGTDSDETELASGFGTPLNALIGGAAGIVLSFVPGSTLLGGGVAGYLEGGQPADGLRVGALAGLVMLVPFVFFGFLASIFFLGAGGSAPGLGVFFVIVLVFGALYTVGLSIVGAVLGIYVKNEL
ncbi:DUF5518 domain-containing protein [Natronorubrum texcoconense]|uniref:DUF5518 domain-containing protein n=1 Tax=Natronorubrum texcoconense TaxID=1095776 RepID=A0A1G9DVN6_9EURY|nr:DUF5518 domain-containing protein [Natronorubrum texcoconense]SDK67967.1 hypothetical protein SAMN04515672_3646 [Natronorubrum texcoconense]